MIGLIIKANRGYRLQTREQIRAIDNLAFDMSHSFRLDNPKFDSDKFMTSCGIDNPHPHTEDHITHCNDCLTSGR